MTPKNPIPSKNPKMVIIGISGGSCSGKTTLSRMIFDLLGKESCNLMYQDNYYHDQSAKFDTDGGAVNFDHPDSIDFSLLCFHLQALGKNESIDCPIYDFSTHKRLEKSVTIEPRPFLIIDGTLILSQKVISDLMDHRIFVDAPEELRLQRRITRDISERGRTKEGVLTQFSSQVKPMHDKFIEPSKKSCTKLVNGTEQDLTNFANTFLDYLKF